MKVKILLILVLSVTTLTAFAQDGGVRAGSFRVRGVWPSTA